MWSPWHWRLALWDRLPSHAEHFCDVSLRSTDGQVFKAHRLVLSMASDPLFAMLSGSFAEGSGGPLSLGQSSAAAAVGVVLVLLVEVWFTLKWVILTWAER
eukprot:s1084_g1.t1